MAIEPRQLCSYAWTQAREAREKYIEQWTDPAVGKKYLARKEARIVKVRIEVVR